jgi:hypothetical protein
MGTPTPCTIIQTFHDAGWSDAQIALLVSAHAGRIVATRTIAGIRRREPGYSGRNLASAFAALASVWQIGK